MNKKWKKRYLGLAAQVGTWSKDPKTQVGAIIVGDKNQVISQGYNGFPRRVFDGKERYLDRDTKLRYVVHAEANAIYNAAFNGTKLQGSTLFVHGLPVCSECAKAIIQVGIKHIVIDYNYEQDDRWVKSFEMTKIMFEEAGISHEFISTKSMPL